MALSKTRLVITLFIDYTHNLVDFIIICNVGKHCFVNATRYGKKKKMHYRT